MQRCDVQPLSARSTEGRKKVGKKVNYLCELYIHSYTRTHSQLARKKQQQQQQQQKVGHGPGGAEKRLKLHKRARCVATRLQACPSAAENPLLAAGVVLSEK
mmetsp:Transcript_2284/g.6852  ORF Transcript_2284/g.6852 Transcript_2284/m.6852 type:complete len:102 (-) Transcript_2284:844-1149(-)